ncbi:hypothetical protein HOP50_05g37140 [Chloropicon primus]|uniref:Uncharacterized protein n=1 Tax=Chloropicon primus TaxID=1764295 RepID=A0A5B8MKN1_9CHLO|nr:hypothetical protein A3770_05p37060 [Chloropicon primus]UPR00400.1 hypothetical protein HOP50_05g37140 [Chloropicon primus]|eukprot:QDZ21188.1 hypothetical protein A3770_05p37060 [Chloropicon primus]
MEIEMEEGSELPRQSLLDVVLESKHRQGKAKLEDRVTILAKTKETQENDEEIRDYILDLLELSTTDEESCTGLILVYPTASVITIEAEQSVLWDVVKRLHSSELDNAPVDNLTILSSSEDISKRAFNMPYSTFLNEASAAAVLIEDADKLISTASAANISILQLGEKLSGLSGDEAQNLLSNLRSSFTTFPTQETFAAIIGAEDTPGVDDFLEFFGKPMNITLDTEVAWPAPEFLEAHL